MYLRSDRMSVVMCVLSACVRCDYVPLHNLIRLLVFNIKIAVLKTCTPWAVTKKDVSDIVCNECSSVEHSVPISKGCPLTVCVIGVCVCVCVCVCV